MRRETTAIVDRWETRTGVPQEPFTRPAPELDEISGPMSAQPLRDLGPPLWGPSVLSSCQSQPGLQLHNLQGVFKNVGLDRRNIYIYRIYIIDMHLSNPDGVAPLVPFSTPFTVIERFRFLTCFSPFRSKNDNTC